MRLPAAPLEYWMRDYYFTTRIDLGSSGVECYTVGEIRQVLGIDQGELDALALDDSPSAGSAALRGTLADRFADGHADHVMATHGSAEAIFLAMNALLSRGDEVVVVDPGYHSLWSIAQAVGCRLVRWRLRPQDRFIPDLDELGCLVGPRTAMVVVNFPNNPTGATLTAGQFDDLVEMVAARGAYLVWDGAFTELTYGTPPLPEPALRYRRTVSFGTMSKAYGLPGLRVGWCIAAPEVLAEFLPLRDAVTICLSPLTEFLAQRAIAGADRLLEPRRKQAWHNLDLLRLWAARHTDVIDWVEPAGGCTAFPALRAPVDADAVCHELGRHHDVLVVPGSCFSHPDRFRLGFGGPSGLFADGLDRISLVLKGAL